jgi:transposase
MWEFRRRHKDLKPEERVHLEDLFEELPELGALYHTREELAEIFDTAPNRKRAAAQMNAWWKNVQEGEMEEQWQAVWDFYQRHRDGILAYFTERKTSGVIEGLNNKARVIIKRCYGLKSVGTLWTRLALEVNHLGEQAGPTH